MTRCHYPTLEAVQAAERGMLCYWHRFLPSPGNEHEKHIMDTLRERYTEAGGYTPELSKQIGWNPKDYLEILKEQG